jgi:hypothetical protein
VQRQVKGADQLRRLCVVQTYLRKPALWRFGVGLRETNFRAMACMRRDGASVTIRAAPPRTICTEFCCIYANLHQSKPASTGAFLSIPHSCTLLNGRGFVFIPATAANGNLNPMADLIDQHRRYSQFTPTLSTWVSSRISLKAVETRRAARSWKTPLGQRQPEAVLLHQRRRSYHGPRPPGLVQATAGGTVAGP